MSPFRISWYHTTDLSDFDLGSPWWISGHREPDGAAMIVAVVRAESEQDAMNIIMHAYDKRPEEVEWRFCDQKPDDYSPFSDRFPRKEWMIWP